jgi:hypothetical protein
VGHLVQAGVAVLEDVGFGIQEKLLAGGGIGCLQQRSHQRRAWHPGQREALLTAEFLEQVPVLNREGA